MSAFQRALCHLYVADMASLFAYYRDVIGLEPESFSPEWSTFRIGLSFQLAQRGHRLSRRRSAPCVAPPR